MATFNLDCPITIVRVAVSAKRGQDFVEVDLNKIPTDVLARGLVEGFRKALADVGGGKEVTDEQRKGMMEKRVATWYAGDWAGTGGGSGDPVGVQIRELIVAAVRKSLGGVTEAKALKQLKDDGVKGTGPEMVACIAAAQSKAAGHDAAAAKAHFEAKLADYTERAKAVLAAQAKAPTVAAKVDLAAL